MVESIFKTVASRAHVEILFYVDEDDESSLFPFQDIEIHVFRGPRITLTDCWNRLIPKATGNLFMQGNDDIVFKTQDWDRMVRDAFARVPDNILMVHGSDEGMHREKFGPHPIVHRAWYNALGYFIPPYFSSDFGDFWVNELANGVGRRVYLPFIVEHMHFLFGKAKKDQTTLERLERHHKDKNDDIWANTKQERYQAIEKLRALAPVPFSKVEAEALAKLVAG